MKICKSFEFFWIDVFATRAPSYKGFTVRIENLKVEILNPSI